jgi:FMN phosphatase YigB (HAD superfamily)
VAFVAASRDFDAIILDVDGTLYRQDPVRLRIAIRLAGAYLTQPLHTRRAIRAIRAFRGSLEELRSTSVADQPAEQLRRTAERTSLSEEQVRSLIEEWMFERPLDLVGGFPQKDLHRFLRLAIQHDIRLGVFSEYPATGKLESLGVREPFAAVVSSFDPEVRRFKPDPAGFLRVATLLGSAPRRTLVIGDRDDADGAGARAAGMRFLEIGGREFPSFEPLCGHLFGS